MEIGKTTAKSRYDHLSSYREPYLLAAYESAEVTIPHEFTRPWSAESSDRLRDEVPVPNQDLGARGVNNLSEKIHLTVFPANTSMLHYIVDPEAKSNTDPKDMAEIEELLTIRERVVMSSIDGARYRAKISPIARQLIIAGNVLINHANNKLRAYKLNRYVTLRDREGEVQEIVLREDLDYQTTEPRVRAIVDEARMVGDVDKEELNVERDIEVYTWVRRDGNVFRHHQEVMNRMVPGTEGVSSVESPQWIAATMYHADGEDYGRGHVEQYLGALKAYDALSQAVVEDAQIAAMAIPLVNPDGRTELKDIRNARNGEAQAGRPDDVGFFRMDKGGDLSVAFSVMQSLEKSISFAFLLNSVVSRDAERVTAEEIREISRELDASLGGFYSTLSEQIQLPIIIGHERQLERKGKIPRLDPKMVKPVILTGLESIGRGMDAFNMQALAQDLSMWSQVMETQFGQAINSKDLLDQITSARSVDGTPFIKSDEQYEKDQQAAEQASQQAAAVETLGPAAIKADSDQAVAETRAAQ